MFAARNHDENAIYSQQTTAAAKSLNQGVKGLAPKTPGARTPSRSKLCDENATYGPSKTGGKRDVGKDQKDAFVTPAGPRNRAPLGNKTTNAKAIALQTGGVGSVKNKTARTLTPQQRRAKVKIHQADPLNATTEDDFPEIEYMPPREVPLPDPPEDWAKDEFPELRGNNFTRGWAMVGLPEPLTADQEHEQWQAKYKLAEEREKRVEEAKKKASVSTLKAKDAVSALSNAAKSRPPISNAPKLRAPVVPVQSKKIPLSRPTGPSHTAARAVSNTTLGYATGRAISASSRPKLSQAHSQSKEKPKEGQSSSTSPFKPGTSIHDLLMLGNVDLEDAEDEEDDDGAMGGVSLDLDADIDLLPPNFELGPVDD